VTFRMRAPAGATYAMGGSGPSEEPSWYVIDGVATQLGDYALCDTCSCTAYQQPGLPPPDCVVSTFYQTYAVPEAGVSWTWDGREVSGCATENPNDGTATCSSSCDGPSGHRSCGDISCAPGGNYDVLFCANGATSGPDCVSVSFVYPSPSEVVGVIR
jgi:hypothetical protein